MDETYNRRTPTTEPQDGNDPQAPSDINLPDPETERLRTEDIELKNAIRTRDACEVITGLLQAAEAHSPDLLFASVKDELQFSDEGELQNAAALVDRLKQQFPEQFETNRPVPLIYGAAGTSSRTQLRAESLAHMTPKQIQKLDWEDVQLALSGR